MERIPLFTDTGCRMGHYAAVKTGELPVSSYEKTTPEGTLPGGVAVAVTASPETVGGRAAHAGVLGMSVGRVEGRLGHGRLGGQGCGPLLPTMVSTTPMLTPTRGALWTAREPMRRDWEDCWYSHPQASEGPKGVCTPTGPLRDYHRRTPCRGVGTPGSPAVVVLLPPVRAASDGTRARGSCRPSTTVCGQAGSRRHLAGPFELRSHISH